MTILRCAYNSPGFIRRAANELVRQQRRTVFGQPRLMRVSQDYLRDKAIIYSQDVSRKTARKIIEEARPEGVNMDKLDELLDSMTTGPVGIGYDRLNQELRKGNIDFKADFLYLFQFKHCGRCRQI